MKAVNLFLCIFFLTGSTYIYSSEQLFNSEIPIVSDNNSCIELDLKKGNNLIISFKVNIKDPINVKLLDRTNYELWLKTKPFESEFELKNFIAGNLLYMDISGTERFFLVLENNSEQAKEVTIKITSLVNDEIPNLPVVLYDFNSPKLLLFNYTLIQFKENEGIYIVLGYSRITPCDFKIISETGNFNIDIYEFKMSDFEEELTPMKSIKSIFSFNQKLLTEETMKIILIELTSNSDQSLSIYFKHLFYYTDNIQEKLGEQESGLPDIERLGDKDSNKETLLFESVFESESLKKGVQRHLERE